MNIFQSLTVAAHTWPDQVAIHDPSGELTFAGLLRETEKLKDQLVRSGLRKGQGVGILLGNNRYFIVALYATLACDAVAMPIGPQQTNEEIMAAVLNANLHFIVAGSPGGFGDSVTQVQSFSFPPLSLHRTSRDRNVPTADFIPSAAVMRFTSGTTGDAKCVVLSHQAVWERTQAANQALELSSSDRVLWVLPMAYHFIVSIMLYIRYGVGIIICDDFLADAMLDRANASGATVLYGAPLHVRLLATQQTAKKFTSLRKVISTTTGISKAICDTFFKHYGIPVMQAFGIIEVGLPIVNTRHALDHPDAVGHLQDSFEVAILDRSFTVQPPGTTGLLALRGPGMFDGYLKPPTPAAALLRNGMFVTGDYASRDEDGLILIRGRSSTMINVSGNKVFPDEVEEILLQYPGVRQARAFGKPHPLLGEVVAAELVLDDAGDFNVEDAIRFCRQHLSSYKVPQWITPVHGIAMTDSGKIKRS
jgi:long-chain acyl-CoA synthetase